VACLHLSDQLLMGGDAKSREKCFLSFVKKFDSIKEALNK